MKQIFHGLLSMLLLTSAPICAQEYIGTNELEKVGYTIQADVVTSSGKYAPFWLVSNKHGLSSLENNNANLSIGIARDFDKKKGFTWAYGAEIAGALNHTSPFYLQQLYADVKYNCWELSIGSKERESEGKHSSLSGGGLTFAPNARPIPQIRFGINEYATVPWCFNGWVHVKGHLSYGGNTDSKFQRIHIAKAPNQALYSENVLLHEKTAFLKIGNEGKSPLSVEIGLEMYTQFGGRLWRKLEEGDTLVYDIPHSYKEYFMALIPMAGASNAPLSERQNIYGNFFGSWHFAANYNSNDWRAKVYYEHFYEDHSGLLGYYYCYHAIDNRKKLIAYVPWYDGLYGTEITFPKNRFINTFVYEYLTSCVQSGPIVNGWQDQLAGKDNYYNHTLYQSWQHWGMAVCNPHTLSPMYNEPNSLKMPYQRLRSHHIGFDGAPTEQFDYRIMGSWTKHWGSYDDPLPEPLTQLSIMAELTYTPTKWQGWQFIGAFALDRSNIIGNNTGGMLTIRKQGMLKQRD